MADEINMLQNMSCKRFEINNKEYLRIEGVWFEYTEDQYIPIDNPAFEQLYQSINQEKVE